MINLNKLVPNYPAVDLGDIKAGIAVQITVKKTSDKIQRTLDEFFAHDRDKVFPNRLLIMIVATQKRYTAEFTLKRPYPDTSVVPGAKSFSKEDDIWDVTRLIKEIKELDAEKIEKIYRYLKEQMGPLPDERLTVESSRPEYRLPPIPMPSGSFVEGSRDDELREMKKRFDECEDGCAPIYLCGMGGIGKTEIAIQFAKKYAPKEGAYFLHYIHSDDGDSMRQSILQTRIEGYRFEKKDNDDRQLEYEDRLRILRIYFKGALVIVDNWDGSDVNVLLREKAFQDLTSLGLRLVITTRFPMSGGLEVKPLSEDILLEVMRSISEKDQQSASDDILIELIREVSSHTLTVNLMAKTLKKMWDDDAAEKMLESLRNSDLDRQDFPEVVKEQNHTYEQKRLYAHLSTLFSFSGMKKNKEECDIMRYATLLPGGGMRDTLFRGCLSTQHHQHLYNLIDRGWLQHKSKLLTLHPVIREVCIGELRPDDQNCAHFLKNLRQYYNPKQYDAQRFGEMAECFSIAAKRLQNRWGDWSYYASELLSEVGQPRAGLQFALITADKRKQLASCADSKNERAMTRQLASSYNMVANALCHLNEYEQALEYGEQALILRKKCFKPGHCQLASSYNNLGMIHAHLGNHQKAMSLLRTALRLRENCEQPNKIEIANSYNNIGTAYYARKKYKDALKYRRKALEIRMEIYADDPNHPDLAASINNVGRTYHEMGQYEDALRLEQQALEIRLKMLRTSDSDLANSYYNVGHTYGAMKKYSDAIANLEMAIKTWEHCGAQDNIYFLSTMREIENLRKEAAAQPE